VKLIFDENLSPTLPHRLSDPFPDATHVETLGFKGRDDLCIWEHTKQIEGAIIVSKDDDFRELALVDGPPPKVITLQIGNCSTKQIETLLRQHHSQIVEFHNNTQSALLELF
jgi:predicted nuclease of predicted toxin-antitoxin system